MPNLSQTLEFVSKLNIIYNGDAKLKQAGDSLQKVQAQTTALQDVAGRVEAYKKQSEQVEKTSGHLTELQTKLRTAGMNAVFSGQRAEDYSIQLKAAQAKLKQMAQTMPKNSDAYKQQAARVRELSRLMKNAKADAKNFGTEQKYLEKQIASTEQQLEKQSKKLQEYESGLSVAKVGVQNLIASQKDMTEALKQSADAQKKLQSIYSNLTWENVEAKIVKPATTFYASISPFVAISRDFEAAMARVKAVGFSGEDADMKEFAAMQNQARQLGSDTQFTSIQAAQTMENLMRAGFDPTQTRAAMPSVLNMAAAEGMDLAQAGSILAGAISGFELPADEAAKVADVLAWTSANSATSISTLGEAVKTAAPMAKKAGMSIQQLMALLGSLGNVQVQGTQAGSTITNALTRLSDKEVQSKLAAYRISTVTRSGQLVAIPEVLRQLEEKTKKFGSSKQIDIFSDIFGTGYGKYTLGLASQVAAGKTQNLETGANTKTSGAAQKMANINLDTLQGQITLLSSAWDGFKLKVGDTFSPVVRAGVELLNSSITTLTSIMEHFPTASKLAVLTMGAFAGFRVVSGIASIGKSILQIPGAFVQVVNAGRNVQNVLASIGAPAIQTGGILAKVAQTASSAFAGLWGIIAANPITATVAGVAAGIILIARNWDSVKAGLKATADYCRKVWGDLTAWWESWSFPDIWASLKQGFIDTINDLKKMWQDICDWFSSMNPFKGANEGIKNAVSHIPDKQVDNAAIALNSWGIPGYATGGIIDKPNIIQVAEHGREAIIPLTDKSRGIPLLMTAAKELGIENFSQQNSSQNFSRLSPQNFSPASVSSTNTENLSRVKNFASSFVNNSQGLSSLNTQNFSAASVSSANTENLSTLNNAKNFASALNTQNFSRSENQSVFDIMNNLVNERSNLENAISSSRNNALYSGSNDRVFTGGAFSPVININVDGSTSPNLAEDISRKVREVLSEISSYQERVAYA